MADIYNKLNKIYHILLINNKKFQQMQDDIYTWKDLVDRQLRELNFANLFHDTISHSKWLLNQSFSLHRWAANYSFIYILYRILDSVQPKRILEMGMGQTSHMTSQYIAYHNLEATLDIIEDDVNWITAYSSQIVQNERSRVYHRDLEFFVYDGVTCRKYKDLNEIIANIKYDLIIIDGPWGGEQKLPRSNILDIIKEGHLSSDFIIIFDDAERTGEQLTISKTKEELKKQHIEFIGFKRVALKTQYIIASKNRSFIVNL